MFIRKIMLSLAVLATIAVPAVSRAAEAPLTKADVEKIVADYITANPKTILESVNAFQAKQMEAQRQAEAEGAKVNIAKNKAVLSDDKTSPFSGNPKGDVTLVEFFDYNCHYCKNAFPAVQALLDKDKNLRVVFKEFPILGPTSETAAKWALAAEKQKKHYEFHKAMMLNKDPISDELLEKVAKDIGMDVAKAKADVALPETQAAIENNRALASELGIRGTPAFVIGDDLTPGAVPQEELEAKIAAARKK